MPGSEQGEQAAEAAEDEQGDAGPGDEQCHEQGERADGDVRVAAAVAQGAQHPVSLTRLGPGRRRIPSYDEPKKLP